MTSPILPALAQHGSTQGNRNRDTRAVRAFRVIGAAARRTFKVAAGNLLRIAPVALSVALMPVAAHANGNMVDSFTYSGSQSGFTPGSVYTVSIAGEELSVCLLTPDENTSAPNLAYNTSCITNAAQNDTNSYTAVAFIGRAVGGFPATPNFAVGDGAGNVYVMQIQFNSGNANPVSLSTIQTLQITDPDNLNAPCGAITSLAIDPTWQYLYAGCVGTAETSLSWRFSKNSYTGGFRKVTLAPLYITDTGYLSTDYYTVPFAYSNVNSFWVTTNSPKAPASAASAVAVPAAAFDGWPSSVNPKMRAYPANYPGLAGTPFYSSGGVLYSGLVSGISGTTPINSAFMCSQAQCTPAYNIALTESGGGAVFTAAELGTNNAGNPVLYWNQLQGIIDPGLDAGIDESAANLLTACQLNNINSSAVTFSPCSTQNNIQWPPVGVPSSTVWLDQLVFSPTPSAIASNTSFTQGLLQISAWNNGYLAYYDVATGSYVPGLFFSNNNAGGEVGANVQGLSTDSNGNLLIQAGASGLLGFNPFPSTSNNIQTQQGTTYIPIPSDNNASSDCGGPCKVVQGLGIVASVITILTASLEDDERSNHTQFALNDPVTRDDRQNSVSAEDNGLIRVALNTLGGMRSDMLGLTATDADPSLFDLAAMLVTAPSAAKQHPDAPSPVLANFLGQKPYWGTFTYSQQQMKLMGIRPGDKIKGMQLRLAEGISAQPKQTLRFKTVQIALKSGAAGTSGQAEWSYGSTVFRRSLNIRRCSYNRSVRDGYGPVIGFERPYRYLGGDLTITLRHSGSGNSKRFYLDAFGGTGVSGAYTQLSSVWSRPTNVTALKVAPTFKFIKKGSAAGDMEAVTSCN